MPFSKYNVEKLRRPSWWWKGSVVGSDTVLMDSPTREVICKWKSRTTPTVTAAPSGEGGYMQVAPWRGTTGTARRGPGSSQATRRRNTVMNNSRWPKPAARCPQSSLSTTWSLLGDQRISLNRHEICLKIHTTRFLGNTFYTLKSRKLRLILLTIAQI